MRFRLPQSRDFYIPKGALKIADKGSDAVAYVHESAGAPYAIAFAGKAVRPAWNYRFRSAADREKRIRDFFADRRASLAAKAERRASRKPAPLKVGDILVSSWGYDQTNVDFYEITALVGATMCELRKIAAATVECAGDMHGRCVAKPGAYIGETMRRRIGESGVRIDSVCHAYPWDGRPRSYSSWA